MADRDWWRGAVIYQIYPRSFFDSSGDGIGDLPGVTARLEYVARLGVDAIWLCPFFVSPQRDFGYDVADHVAVDPLFGTLADFDALLARAHGLGLKVLIDQVWSHTSDRHAWFLDSRAGRTGAKADWFRRRYTGKYPARRRFGNTPAFSSDDFPNPDWPTRPHHRSALDFDRNNTGPVLQLAAVKVHRRLARGGRRGHGNLVDVNLLREHSPGITSRRRGRSARNADRRSA